MKYHFSNSQTSSESGNLSSEISVRGYDLYSALFAKRERNSTRWPDQFGVKVMLYV